MGKYQAYPEYQASGISGLDTLPSHWNTKQVRYLLKDGAEGIKIGPFGSALKLEDMVEDGIFVFGQENVIKKNFSLGKRRISDSKFKEMEVYKATPGDILITMMGTSGKCEIVPETAALGIIDSHLLRLRVREDMVKSDFFKLLIDESPEVAFQIRQQGKGSIMHGLNSSIVKSLFLPLPDIEEQSAILSFLDHETAKIDTLIEKQQQLIKLLKEKRQAVISHAVTKGLNPQAPMKDSGVEWLGEVPEHWVVSRFKYCADRVIVGIAEAATHAYSETGTVLIRSTNIKEDGLTTHNLLYLKTKFADQNESKYIRGGDIVTVRTGYPGISAVVPDSLDRSHCFTNLISTPKIKFVGGYLTEYLNSDMGKAYFDLNAWGSAQKNISVPILQEFPIAHPDINEQQEILRFVEQQRSKFDNLLNASQKSIEFMKERRTALISAAVIGKIDVRNWQAPTHQDQALEQTA
ncbi:restriction endonuclease subunit S [Vibrio harveyi]|uniref:restriction endonuclease subunit S n=1 Tax=Vibrio harveyi TaxID=669 RepID=UPI000D78AF4C|nr:restriction endonuclease subunit S [Vibrio harveyi]GBL00085.1 restriction endonuclease subunit S [Vibrio harveyi]